MADKSKLWYLENFNLFSEMNKEEMKMVAANTKMRSAKKGQYIYFPEDPSTSIFLLKEGRIKIGSFSSDGKELIKAVLKPGEIFGELALIGEGKRNDFAQVIDDEVLVCAMEMKQMEALMARSSGLSLKVTKLIGWRLRKTERKLNDLIFKDARQRIIEFIVDMADEDGVAIGDEIMVKHRFTHQDMASLTATSRQTVTTVLNELKDRDLLYMERQKFLIRDIQQLR